ncbi:transglutaminase-like cysteine peptidase [Sphingomonas lutea]|uniref:Transglutaminase-like cysteine peptidase n=1 Tax=Sphingomonas lutea TaxID=1045317 RepID=A0A7G9SI21_9SPHN|nr:transglutaminase-like cysteine peptidase [Sphingomonas lutea]QNN67496.1 transglutaminase-like cysteine peptidase [Sphingomonas lutea]
MGRILLGALCAAAAVTCSPAAAEPAPVASAGPAIIVTANAGPNMLGTIALPIRAARFAESWARASADATRSPELQRMIAPGRAMGRLQKVNFVQAAVHARVRWMSDATQWGQHDYWATAEQTLAKGAGDMEDRAIVKMQALRALGFDHRDLFLTLGRDRVGGPITVLMVRIDDRYFMVDDTGGPATLLDRRGFEFQPQLSFGSAGSWIHARKIPAKRTAAAISAASASRN